MAFVGGPLVTLYREDDENLQHRFTLYCIPGHLFRPGRHYLRLDEWITDPSFLILSHGIMSEQEYQHFCSQKSIPIYQSVSYCWIGLYPAHESKKYGDTQYCGRLFRKSNTEWSGLIHVC